MLYFKVFIQLQLLLFLLFCNSGLSFNFGKIKQQNSKLITCKAVVKQPDFPTDENKSTNYNFIQRFFRRLFGKDNLEHIKNKITYVTNNDNCVKIDVNTLKDKEKFIALGIEYILIRKEELDQVDLLFDESQYTLISASAIVSMIEDSPSVRVDDVVGQPSPLRGNESK